MQARLPALSRKGAASHDKEVSFLNATTCSLTSCMGLFFFLLFFCFIWLWTQCTVLRNAEMLVEGMAALFISYFSISGNIPMLKADRNELLLGHRYLEERAVLLPSWLLLGQFGVKNVSQLCDITLEKTQTLDKSVQFLRNMQINF